MGGQGDKAIVDLIFDHLVPNGLYPVWCNTLRFDMAVIEEYPAWAPDGLEYGFTADENGHAEINMEINAFPPSTIETFCEIAIAYHSDGQSVGEHGRNAYGQMYYDFMPPAEERSKKINL